jgi:hypothetical protein
MRWPVFGPWSAERRMMTLTIGTGPFGDQSAGTFNFDTGVLRRPPCTSRTPHDECE